MTDYSKLELRLKNFLRQLERYRNIYIRLMKRSGYETNNGLYEEERKIRNKLTKEYGELQADIHGMAGYNEMTIAGRIFDIFLTALDPRLEENPAKNYGIDYSIQCLNKAIGSCRNARKVVKTDDQIIIKKGAQLQGLLEIRKILKKAEKEICIQDRYIKVDIFDFIEEIDKNVKIRIVIKKEKYSGKPMLKKGYKIYRDVEKNVEIRECEQKEFHSRKIIIDGKDGYNPDFTLQDIGKTESCLSKIKNIKASKEEFETLWSIATTLSI